MYCTSNYAVVPELKNVDYASPDTTLIKESPLSIGTVRQLINAAHQKPVVAPERLFVVVASSIAQEAQHAFLKILEEPPQTSRFVLVIPNKEKLLPTVLSRLQVVDVENERDNTPWNEFIKLSYRQRLELIAEKTKSRDLLWINDIIEAAAEQSVSSELATRQSVQLALIHKDDRGASRKMLLEELALSLPIGG